MCVQNLYQNAAARIRDSADLSAYTAGPVSWRILKSAGWEGADEPVADGADGRADNHAHLFVCLIYLAVSASLTLSLIFLSVLASLSSSLPVSASLSVSLVFVFVSACQPLYLAQPLWLPHYLC